MSELICGTCDKKIGKCKMCGLELDSYEDYACNGDGTHNHIEC